MYSRLNRSEPYLANELRWLAEEAKSNARFAASPFRIVLMHQPEWGSMPDGQAQWIATANEGVAEAETRRLDAAEREERGHQASKQRVADADKYRDL